MNYNELSNDEIDDTDGSGYEWYKDLVGGPKHPVQAQPKTHNADGIPFHICTQCDPNHIDNCRTCFGYGLSLNRDPLSASVGGNTNINFIRCPECDGTPAGYVAAAPGGES